MQVVRCESEEDAAWAWEYSSQTSYAADEASCGVESETTNLKCTGVNDSWSFKYNLLWQRLLKLDGPFPCDRLAPTL